MNSDSISKEFPKALLSWYKFKKKSNTLLITDRANDVLKELLEDKCGKVVVKNYLEEKQEDCFELYDYIVLSNVFEYYDNPVKELTKLKKNLKKDGHLLAGVNNRLGIKYFCGDRDPYTNHSFDGIENYRGLTSADRQSISGRCYSKAELEAILIESGFETNKFYAVLPNLNEAQLVYADGFLPEEELAMRYFPIYSYPDSVFLNEEFLYNDLIKNGLFHSMANSYLIECSMSGEFDNTIHATISMDRGPSDALVTSICEQNGMKKVYKKAVFHEAEQKINVIYENMQYLSGRGINMVNSTMKDGAMIMPYVDSPIAMIALKKLAKKDKSAFINAIDVMYEIILQSSPHTNEINEKDKNSANGRNLGVILKKGFIDLVPLNCFYDETAADPKQRYIFFDQEFYYNNCPAMAILHRSISIIYDGTDKEFETIVPKDEIIQRYGLKECEDIWQRMSDRFTYELRNQRELAQYYYNKKCDARVLYTNREKINYNSADYSRIFINIFNGIVEAEHNGIYKKLILFGSGIFMHKFLAQFSGDYKIYSIIDNNSEKWGTLIDGIPVNSPSILRDISKEELHLIICIKRYYGVLNQLKNMGITEYYIYDPGINYPNKRRNRINKTLTASNNISDNLCNIVSDIKEETQDKDIKNKKEKLYNVGYIAGVFDLFHVGHLNMFKRAKEMCNYLIVGVVSDEGVRLNKQTQPFVPFEERLEMVKSCRYVDEAVKLPLNFAGTRDMFRVYNFDVQFSGSDYMNDPLWLEEKEFLEKNGAEMVFFPYTETTSSTKLKALIDKKLLI